MTGSWAPALRRARPGGAIPGTYQPARWDICDVYMTDQRWHHAETLGWARDHGHDSQGRGRWRILLRWYSDGQQNEEWFIYAAAKIRPVT